MNIHKDIEQLILGKGLKGPSLSPGEVESLIAETQYTLLPNKRSTVCSITLVNGFTVNGISSVVSGVDYDEEVGRITAHKKAMSEVWDIATALFTEKLHQAKLAEQLEDLRGTGEYFKHHKGDIYKLLHIAKNEADLDEVAVYQAVKDGVIYTRPAREFYEKFTCVVDLSAEEGLKLQVQAEYDELKVKYSQMESSLGMGQPEYVTDNHWWLIKRQLAPMREYHEVLTARIIDLDQQKDQ